MINNLRAFQEVLKRNNLPTPDTYLGISELIRSLYRPDVSPNPERIREVLEELTWPVTVPSGNPITFKSCSEVLASKALVTFAPKQSGTGDPSPTNIRPISGWGNVDLNQCGKNLFDENYTEISDTVTYKQIKVQDGTYTFSTNCPKNGLNAANLFAFGGYITSGGSSNVNGLWEGQARTFYSVDGYITIAYRNSPGIRPLDYHTQIELGSTATAYEPYQGETHTANFPSTVYGGSYDFVTGKGVSEWGYIAEYNGETITEPWLSSIDVYAPGTTPSTGAEVVYKLVTPTEIELTPEEIELLRGINNIWTDGDNVTVKFQILK